MTSSPEVLELLKNLVSIPSQNPMGRSIPLTEESISSGWYEHRIIDYLEDYLKRRGFAPYRMDAGGGRCNVLVRLEGSLSRPVIFWDAHCDTVPVDGMTIEPFQPTILDGRLYGRGACDVKGGLAAMISGLVELSTMPPDQRSTVILCCSCDEELGQLGMKRLMQYIDRKGHEADELLARVPFELMPDVVVVAEPTELDVVVAHMGVTRWRMVVEGTPAHSSEPTRGINAIYRMAKMVSCLETYAESLGRRAKHPLCGGPSMSVGRIEGGTSVNVVPARCEIEIDRRIAPGEECDGAIEDVRRYLEERLDFPFQFEPPWCRHQPLQDDENRQLAEHLLQSARRFHFDSRAKGVRFGTHATNFSSRGIPTVVFGPGSIEQAHTKDEWIEVVQLEKAMGVLVDMVVRPF